MLVGYDLNCKQFVVVVVVVVVVISVSLAHI